MSLLFPPMFDPIVFCLFVIYFICGTRRFCACERDEPRMSRAARLFSSRLWVCRPVTLPAINNKPVTDEMTVEKVSVSHEDAARPEAGVASQEQMPESEISNHFYRFDPQAFTHFFPISFRLPPKMRIHNESPDLTSH